MNIHLSPEIYSSLRSLSSSPCNCTSSNGIMCCLLYFFLLITILPYTRMSLNRKNCLAFGRLRHIFVKTPSPTSTRPCIFSGCRAEGKRQTTIKSNEMRANVRTRSTYFSRTAEAALHHRYSACVRLAVNWNSTRNKKQLLKYLSTAFQSISVGCHVNMSLVRIKPK